MEFKMLGVMDTIANETEYIEIAVRLVLTMEPALLSKWYSAIPYLYDDRTCVEALERFIV